MLFLETTLGQYSGRGPTQVFGRLSPIMKGLGYTMIATTFFFAIYYNVIIAWAVHYLFAGMAPQLPWSACPNATSPDETNYRPRCLSLNDGTSCCYEQVMEAFISSQSKVSNFQTFLCTISIQIFQPFSMPGYLGRLLLLLAIIRVPTVRAC